ncbi:MAG: asparagine--tRNA ligase [Akkermansiaceae bacterium]|jgi:asparaginyl-tRNA synthetase|nr:asparagine--tRNA ligase [Akkermansiaceae bacterium]
MTIKEALASNNPIDDITISGWVRTRRDSKGFSFLSINDGSCLANIQAIVDDGIPGSESISMATTGSSVKLKGQLVESPGKGQSFEIKASEIEVTGTADDTYPLQKKGHSPEFLREISHLRPRSNLFGCVFRTRSRLAYAIHQFFQKKGFVYVHTPIITASDCEGAGEMFRVTTLDGNQADKENDFFGKPTYLTVSGQLEVETFACALSNVYTFGPTFRAENSNTTRHASEFWMVEPEMAYCDLEGDMDLAEEMIQYLIKDTLEHCSEDLDLFGKFVDKGLLERLHSVSNQAFQRISYTEAVKILETTEMKFEYPVEWGINLQTEHERFLTEEHFKSPVTVHDYPRSIKPFYMRINDDEKTSAAMDLLVPGIGEIIGGSQREERLDVLMKNMEEHSISKDDYSWYSDLRKYGTVPHSGFGLGFERMLMFVTGVANIRDVIPFPRTPGSANF